MLVPLAVLAANNWGWPPQTLLGGLPPNPDMGRILIKIAHPVLSFVG